MSEVKEARKVINPLQPVKENELVTLVGFGRGAKVVYGIKWSVPATEEEAQERYNCSLTALVASGVRGFATRPDYQTAGFNDSGELLDNGHEAMQTLADNYRCGVRKASVKSEDQKALEALCADKGLSLAELIEKAKVL